MGDVFMYVLFAVIGVAVIIAAAVLLGKNNGSPVLVLQQFKLNENEDGFLKIQGRASGIMSWILSVCGIDPVSCLICGRQAVKFESASVRYGKKTINIPMVAVTAVVSELHKPFGLLVFGILFGLAGILLALALTSLSVFLLFVIAAGVCLLLYFFRKTMRFTIYAGGDNPAVTIRVKKSIIEGQNIDKDKFEQAATALNKAALEIHVTLGAQKA